MIYPALSCEYVRNACKGWLSTEDQVEGDLVFFAIITLHNIFQPLMLLLIASPYLT